MKWYWMLFQFVGDPLLHEYTVMEQGFVANLLQYVHVKAKGNLIVIPSKRIHYTY